MLMITLKFASEIAMLVNSLKQSFNLRFAIIALEGYYSLSLSDELCNLCPSNAYCPGGNIIITDEGY